MENPVVDADALARDWPFVGAAFDLAGSRVELMFAADRCPERHLTHVVSGVTSVVMTRDGAGRDLTLSIGHGAGRTWLTFTS